MNSIPDWSKALLATARRLACNRGLRAPGGEATSYFMIIIFVINIVLRTTADVQGQDNKVQTELDQDSPQAQELMKCYNENFSNEVFNFDAFKQGRISRSWRLHRVWWSRRAVSPTLTIFAMTDLGRLQALEAQCWSYPNGPLVVALYLPLIAQASDQAVAGAEPQLSPTSAFILQNATKALDDLFQRIDKQQQQQARTPCGLRLLLIYELVQDEVAATLFPINSMRNAALLAVDTPLAAMVDIDLSASWSLAARLLANASRTAELVAAADRERSVWVLPTWDVNRRIDLVRGNAIANSAAQVLPEEKMVLHDMWMSKNLIQPFAFERFPIGHKATDYEKWCQSPEPYKVQHNHGYEPWYIMSRKHIRTYDARFRGRGHDKTIYTLNLVIQGYAIWVLPDVWLVHQPHGPTALTPTNYFPWMNISASMKAIMAKDVVVEGTRRVPISTAVFAVNNGHNVQAETLIRHRMYDPAVEIPTQHCWSVLSWWRQPL